LPESISTVFFENIFGYDKIAPALAHFESVLTKDHPIDENLIPWSLPGERN
jgi:hypothetical protein